MYTFNNFTYTFVVEYENEIFLYISRQYLGIFITIIMTQFDAI